MKKNYKLFLTAAAGVASLLQAAWGDGYRNPPPTAEGIAKSGVNSVWVDDASAVSYNPANLAFQTNHSVVVSVTMARTENTYTIPTVGSFESDGDWNALPNFYYSAPSGVEDLVFGLGITTPYGQGLSWDKDELDALILAGESMVPYDAAVLYLNFNPSVAFKFSDSFSVGGGLNISYSEMELKTLVDLSAFGLPVPSAAYDAAASGDGWGVGANLGVTWIPAEGHQLAATYRSQTKITYEGDFEVPSLGQKADFETEIKYPDTVSLGYGVQLSDDVQLEAMVEWLRWSVNKGQVLDIDGFPSTTLDNSWDDTFTFGIGGSWQALDSLAVRAGYVFIPSPVPDETLSHLLPDADRHAISFGLGYTVGAHTLDMAYTLSLYEERSSASSGIYEIDSDLVGLTYSASF